MKIINNCSFAVIAFGWHLEYGYGEDVRIEPGQSAEIAGPYVGELGKGSCFIALSGEDVVCQEAPDDENGFHVSMGNQLSLGSGSTGSRGMTVRHFSEDRKLD
ncbi:MAG: hypothetical protein ACD_15C00175G0004 [uncultured bacterium]|nr:MAG: hypothetical protein ACD_15C00175G0004 [uncultured bacterium]